MRRVLCKWIINFLQRCGYELLDMAEYHKIFESLEACDLIFKHEQKIKGLEKKLDELHAVEGRIAESAEMSAQQQKEMTEIINEYLFGDE